MNKELKQLMKNFESDSTGRKRYNDFLLHCFTTFENTIKLNKSKKRINKYNNMRQNLINYLIANEREITLELSK